MARYIDADKLEEWVYAFHLADAYWAIPMLRNAPTADVVPKSEVAREIIDELLEALQGEVDAEEKLESNDWNYSDTVGYQIHRYAGDKLETLAIALSLYKKKYTEGETDV